MRVGKFRESLYQIRGKSLYEVFQIIILARYRQWAKWKPSWWIYSHQLVEKKRSVIAHSEGLHRLRKVNSAWTHLRLWSCGWKLPEGCREERVAERHLSCLPTFSHDSNALVSAPALEEVQAQGRHQTGSIDSGCTSDQDLLPVLEPCHNLASCGQSPIELIPRQWASVVVVRRMDHGQTRKFQGRDLPLQCGKDQSMKTQRGKKSTPRRNRTLPKARNYLIRVKHNWLVGPKDQRRRFAFGFFSTNFSPFQ